MLYTANEGQTSTEGLEAMEQPQEATSQSAGGYRKRPAKIYVGKLPLSVSKGELEDLFGRYGAIEAVELKHGGYAFIQFANHSDAESAVSNLDGYRLEDSQITVEFSKKRDLLGNSCLICNEEGHWARDCPLNKEKGLDVKSGKCFKCGSIGHLARFCRGQQDSGRSERARSRSPSSRGYGYNDYSSDRRGYGRESSSSGRGGYGRDSGSDYRKSNDHGDRYNGRSTGGSYASGGQRGSTTSAGGDTRDRDYYDSSRRGASSYGRSQQPAGYYEYDYRTSGYGRTGYDAGSAYGSTDYYGRRPDRSRSDYDDPRVAEGKDYGGPLVDSASRSASGLTNAATGGDRVSGSLDASDRRSPRDYAQKKTANPDVLTDPRIGASVAAATPVHDYSSRNGYDPRDYDSRGGYYYDRPHDASRMYHRDYDYSAYPPNASYGASNHTDAMYHSYESERDYYRTHSGDPYDASYYSHAPPTTTAAAAGHSERGNGRASDVPLSEGVSGSRAAEERGYRDYSSYK